MVLTCTADNTNQNGTPRVQKSHKSQQLFLLKYIITHGVSPSCREPSSRSRKPSFRLTHPKSHEMVSISYFHFPKSPRSSFYIPQTPDLQKFSIQKVSSRSTVLSSQLIAYPAIARLTMLSLASVDQSAPALDHTQPLCAEHLMA